MDDSEPPPIIHPGYFRSFQPAPKIDLHQAAGTVGRKHQVEVGIGKVASCHNLPAEIQLLIG